MNEKLEMYLNAGFTKDDLIQMGVIEIKTPEPTPEPTPELDTLSAGINELLAEMHSTLKSMQAANIQGSRMPEESREKPEDILASLIYPSFKKENEK